MIKLRLNGNAFLTSLLFLLILGLSVADGMDMDADVSEDTLYLQKLAENIDKKTIFHWILSVLMLMVIPSFGMCFSLANMFPSGILIQVICASYAVVEALVLRFPDPEGHENSASRGTAWVLAFLYCLNIFLGSLSTGSSVFVSSTTANKIGMVGAKVTINAYKISSVLLVLCGFIKAGMSIISLTGFCYNYHTGQCNAHGIMGTGLIAYSVFLSAMLVIPWLRLGSGQRLSQEMYDSTMLTAWGIVNTFTEHRPWEPWSHGDYQHTSMGIIFWTCGMLGMFLSRNSKRNFLPAMTLIFTGYAMSGHVQKLIISTKVHGFFGWVLILSGFARIWEISFVLKDKRCDNNKILSFQYIPPFGLLLAGICFMGATEEQLQLVVDMGADSNSYILVLASCACVLQLWILIVLEFYLKLVGYSMNDSNHYNMLGEDEIPDIEDNAMGSGHNDFEMEQFSDSENNTNRDTPGDH